MTPMNNLSNFNLGAAICSLALSLVYPALSQTDSRQNAQGVLEKAEHIEYEHAMAARQKELDRLNEDIENGKKHSYELEQILNAVGNEISQAKSRRDQLVLLRKEQPKVLEIISMRLEAENLKTEGLIMLEAAQKKALDALGKRGEEAEQRTNLQALEMKLFAEKTLAKSTRSEESRQKQEPSVTELRKKLEKAERAASNASAAAGEAMRAASLKLQQASNAAAKAESRRIELGLDEIPQLPTGKQNLEPPKEKAPKKRQPKH